MVEEKKDKSAGWMVVLAIFLITLTLCVGIYAYLSEPYRVSGLLKEHLVSLGDTVSDEYQQGWLDCISYYMNEIYGPTNMTSCLGGD